MFFSFLLYYYVRSRSKQSNVVIAGAVPDAESVRALVGPATLRFAQRDGSLGPPILFEDMYYKTACRG